MHPAIVKATKIGNHAVSQGWKGHLTSHVVDNEPFQNHWRQTVLLLMRNDERLICEWRNSHFNKAVYKLFDEHMCDIPYLPGLKNFIFGWPDLLKLFEYFPEKNRPRLTEIYRQLPFKFDDDNETIIESIVRKQIWWWESVSQKIRCDTILPKGTIKITPVGHRKMLQFKGTIAGQRNVLLDTILKVK